MTELPSLLKLCDDSSPVVAEKVARRLRELGPSVWDEIGALEIELSDSQRAALEAIFAPSGDDALREAWRQLAGQRNEHRYLENALLCLADWQDGSGASARGRQLLDELATQFGDYDGKNAHSSDAGALAYFLFEVKGLSGASPDDSYNPLHSNLVYALESRRGLPITLACVFILVGRRVGLDIEGCAFPGHFLARDGRSEQIFDPFNGGRALSPREIATLAKVAPDEINGSASAREIVARVLRNLSVAYYQSGEDPKSGLMLSLLRQMDDN
ncbi:MAG: transglutaminase-like domain-containing protein [Armatimonadetes bacterium]|nr:transglutaminase-like domain-containing protein [Armatimonadota bacterium]